MKNLVPIFKKYGINLSKIQEKQFEDYFSMLIETNKVMNLTAITEEDEVIVKHFLDSVLPERFFQKGASVVDVGSGAGFPAIPLKILRSDLKVCMVDSLNKRVEFLKNVISSLNLQETEAVHSRAEDFCKNHRQIFDVAVARAVAELNTLVEYLLPLIKVGGIAIIYKSAKLDEELAKAKNAIKTLGGEVEQVESFVLENNIERKVLIVRKVASTPAKYPRGQNKPRISPIE